MLPTALAYFLRAGWELLNLEENTSCDKPTCTTALLLGAWLVVLVAFWFFVRQWMAPDACLDLLHGSFDYQQWQCDLENDHEFINVMFFELPAFWVFAALAFGVLALRRKLQRGQSAPATPSSY